METFTDAMTLEDLSPGQLFYSCDTELGARRIILSDTHPHLGRDFSYSAPGFRCSVHAPRADRPEMGPPSEGWWAEVQWFIVGGSQVYQTHDGSVSSFHEQWRGDEGDEEGLSRGFKIDHPDMIGVASYDKRHGGFRASPHEMTRWITESELVPSALIQVFASAMRSYEGPSEWVVSEQRWRNGPVE